MPGGGEKHGPADVPEQSGEGGVKGVGDTEPEHRLMDRSEDWCSWDGLSRRVTRLMS